MTRILRFLNEGIDLETNQLENRRLEIERMKTRVEREEKEIKEKEQFIRELTATRDIVAGMERDAEKS